MLYQFLRDTKPASEPTRPQSPWTSSSSVAFICHRTCRDLPVAYRIMSFLCLAILLPLCMSAQAAGKLKPVTTKSGTRPKIIEQYVVRASDGLREGGYTRTRGKVVVQTGHYQNGMRDSLWADYALDGQKIAEGRMNADHKTGVWTYLSFAGDTIQRYDHDRGLLLQYDRESEQILFPTGFLIAESVADTLAARGNVRLPAYIGGLTMILHLISSNLAYPMRDLENGVQGIVLLGFTADQQGRTRDLRILKSVSPGIDEEALRLGALLGDNWVPGEVDGRKVNVRFTLPLQFKLE